MRQDIIRSANEIPLAGHIGKQNTTTRILKRFCWLRIFSDVAEYVRHCSVCQRTASARVTQTTVRVIPLPSIGVPFQRVATDNDGPLPNTPGGNQYILVVVDYATRYPKALAKKSTDAEMVALELVKIFARLRIPDELLTDQGSNSVSELLNQLSSLLRIRRIQTSPYHCQTDGLVERFKDTLMRMQRRFVQYHDRLGRNRSLEPGDQVLLLLLTSPRKLKAAWQGPFRFLRKLGPVDYEIELEGRRKKRRVVHLNMLNKWFPPLTLAAYIDHQAPHEDPEEMAEAFAFSAENSRCDNSLGPDICDELTTDQKQELQALLW